MTKKLLFVSTIVLALALVALAADVSGKWTFDRTMPGRGGGDPVTITTSLTLKADGGKLTGSMTGGGGMGRGGGGGGQAPAAQEISNGKVDGNKVTFEVSRPGRGGGDPVVTKYEGTLDGDSLKLHWMQPGRGGADPTPVDVTAKRATT